jgi:hypothetical protein
VVIDAGGATVAPGQLLWEADVQPGEARLLQATLQLPLPLGQPPLPSTMVSAYDAVNDEWLGFQPAPAVVQVVQPPAPQIQLAASTGGGFAVDLQAFVPGVYRVEASSDFSSWTPVGTVTNAAGVFRVTDGDAQTYPHRFYRGVER